MKLLLIEIFIEWVKLKIIENIMIFDMETKKNIALFGITIYELFAFIVQAIVIWEIFSQEMGTLFVHSNKFFPPAAHIPGDRKEVDAES